MKSTSRTHRSGSSIAICLASVLMLCFAPLQSVATAAVEAGSMPKEWPANPAKHQIVIRREAADAKETAMIAAAEAAQASKEALSKAAGDAAVPAGNKVWWYEEKLGIRIPCAITSDAIAYYSDLVGSYGKQALKRFMDPSSSLDYHAGVKFHNELKLDDTDFRDVHVVTLKLTFSENFAASTTEAMRFQKERVVVLDANGKVLHISGDGPTEVPILAI